MGCTRMLFNTMRMSARERGAPVVAAERDFVGVLVSGNHPPLRGPKSCPRHHSNTPLQPLNP